MEKRNVEYMLNKLSASCLASIVRAVSAYALNMVEHSTGLLQVLCTVVEEPRSGFIVSVVCAAKRIRCVMLVLGLRDHFPLSNVAYRTTATQAQLQWLLHTESVTCMISTSE